MASCSDVGRGFAVTCQDRFFLLDANCLFLCPIGMTGNPSTGKCECTSTNAATCDSDGNPLTCAGSTALFVPDDGRTPPTCQPLCSANQAFDTAATTAGACKCADGYTTFQQQSAALPYPHLGPVQCVRACPGATSLDYGSDDGACQCDLSQGEADCDVTTGYVTTCDSSYFLDGTGTSATCAPSPSCPTGTTLTDKASCVCPATVVHGQCSSTDGVSCATGYSLSAGACVCSAAHATGCDDSGGPTGCDTVYVLFVPAAGSELTAPSYELPCASGKVFDTASPTAGACKCSAPHARSCGPMGDVYECDPGYTAFRLPFAFGKCLANCDPGYGLDISGTCVCSAPSAATCDAGGVPTACKSPAQLFTPGPGSELTAASCAAACPGGQRFDLGSSTAGACEVCPDGQATACDATGSTACNSGLSLWTPSSHSSQTQTSCQSTPSGNRVFDTDSGTPGATKCPAFVTGQTACDADGYVSECDVNYYLDGLGSAATCKFIPYCPQGTTFNQASSACQCTAASLADPHGTCDPDYGFACNSGFTPTTFGAATLCSSTCQSALANSVDAGPYPTTPGASICASLCANKVPGYFGYAITRYVLLSGYDLCSCFTVPRATPDAWGTLVSPYKCGAPGTSVPTYFAVSQRV